MNSIVNRRNIGVTPWICAVLLLVVSQPFWTWDTVEFVAIVVPLLILLFAWRDIRQSKIGLWGVIAWVFQLYILSFFNKSTNVNGFLFLIIKWIGFASIFLCSASFIRNCMECFIRIIAVFFIFAIIEHLLICFWGKSLVSPSVRSQFELGRTFYVYLLNTYIQFQYDSFSVFRRFAAFYEEPGVIGNITMVLLYAQRFDFKKWYNIVLLISGILSFSLAFYIAIIAYYIIFGSTKAKIAFSIVALLSVYYFSNNEYLYDVLFGRLEFENGGLAGYNRENEDFKFWFSGVKLEEYLFSGYKPKEAVPYAASWQWAFALIGVIPSVLYLIVLLISRRTGIKGFGDLLKGVVIISIIWIQRPFVYSYFYVLMMVLPFIFYQTDYTLIKTEKLGKTKSLLVNNSTING